MCGSCGCGRYEESHDDERNITVSSLQRAADAANLTIEQVMQSMVEGCSRMLAHGVPQHTSTGQAVLERLRPD